MEHNLSKALHLLREGDYTCVVCRGDVVLTTVQRGVAPLLSWLDSGADLSGFSAADRVVGRGAAFLYCLLGVKEVYARVMSLPAAEVLRAHNIHADAELFVDGIINRAGDGPCPFEAAVMDIRNAEEALTAIRAKRTELRKGVNS